MVQAQSVAQSGRLRRGSELAGVAILCSSRMGFLPDVLKSAFLGQLACRFHRMEIATFIKAANILFHGSRRDAQRSSGQAGRLDSCDV